MRIYQILQNLYIGDSIEFPDHEEGIPFGYTRSPPPEGDIPPNNYIKWNGHEWEYTTVSPPAIKSEPKIISKLGFLNRIGDDSYIAILTAAKTDVVVEAWLNKFNLMNTIDLTDEKTQSTLDMFVSKGLMTQEQADQILNNPVTTLE